MLDKRWKKKEKIVNLGEKERVMCQNNTKTVKNLLCAAFFLR